MNAKWIVRPLRAFPGGWKLWNMAPVTPTNATSAPSKGEYIRAGMSLIALVAAVVAGLRD